jgi:hypothetical protein
MLTKVVVLHHDNGEPHMAGVTTETFQRLKFKLLPHPAYSLDLAKLDQHILGLLKDALCGYQFGNNEKMKDMVYMALRAQLKTFFKMCICRFMHNRKHSSQMTSGSPCTKVTM